MINKDIRHINYDDINNLLIAGIAESKTLDYKLDIPKDWITTIIAFANTNGGDLIIGIKESKGVPIEIIGINIENVDAFKLQLSSQLNDKTNPRITRYDIKCIKTNLSLKNYIVLVRVYESWIKPHMLGESNFYLRSVSGNQRMDISQITDTILLSRTNEEKIIEFKNKKLIKIISGEINNFRLENSPRIAIQIIPMSSISSKLDININNVVSKSRVYIGQSFIRQASGGRKNIDGYIYILSKEHTDLNNCNGYTQFYKNGMIEDCNNRYFNTSRQFLYDNFINEIVIFFACSLRYYRDIQVEGPIYFFISLIGCKGYFFNGYQADIYENNSKLNTIDRDNMQLPEYLLEYYYADLSDVEFENYLLKEIDNFYFYLQNICESIFNI